MKKKILLLGLILLNSCSNKNDTFLDTSTVINNAPVSVIANSKSLEPLDAAKLRVEYMKPSHQWPKANVDSDLEYREIGSLPTVRYARNNAYTVEKYNLGRMLFFESKLSGSGSMSCNSCHNPNQGWADNLATPVGSDMAPLKRNSPSIVNIVHNTTMFWDGRAKTPEEQAVAVLLNPREMNSSEEIIKDHLKDSPIYKNLFKQAFGSEEVTLENVSKAIAVFERSIVTKNKSPFDQFLAGKSNALSDSQVRGMHIFRTSARCMNCHSGFNFTDNKMHNIGLVLQGTKFEDTGRFEVTNKPEDYGLFKTPSLRNVTKTAPYFHNGLVLNLKGLLNIYSNGMPASQNKSKHIIPIGIDSQDRADLQAFLEALAEDVPLDSRR